MPIQCVFNVMTLIREDGKKSKSIGAWKKNIKMRLLSKLFYSKVYTYCNYDIFKYNKWINCFSSALILLRTSI